MNRLGGVSSAASSEDALARIEELQKTILPVLVAGPAATSRDSKKLGILKRDLRREQAEAVDAKRPKRAARPIVPEAKRPKRVHAGGHRSVTHIAKL